MELILASMFRNAATYLDRYFAQAEAFRAIFPTLRLLLVEGDSTDGTRAELMARIDAWPASAEIVFRDHGGPAFGSVDSAQRWRQISYACNGVWDNIPPDAAAVIYVEGDLYWTPDVMCTLLADAARFSTYPGASISPMCFHRGTSIFYDIWGYRRNGHMFSQFPPYIPEYEPPADLIRIDSCGSCWVMPGGLARLVRYDETALDGPLSFARSIWAAGGSMWLNPTVRVEHP